MEQLQHRLTTFEDEWSIIRKFYENYSQVTSVSVSEVDEKSLGNKIQEEIDSFEDMREKKRQEEIERLRMIEVMKEMQRLKEEEELAAAEAKRKAEEEEAARKVIGKFIFYNFYYKLKKIIYF